MHLENLTFRLENSADYRKVEEMTEKLFGIYSNQVVRSI
jgi:hypothetical protein